MIKITSFISLAFFAAKAVAGWDMAVRIDPVSVYYGYYYAKLTRWDTQDNTPNPMYGCRMSDAGCSIHFTYNNSAFDNLIYFPEIRTSKTVGELAQHFIDKGYLNKEYRSRQLSPDSKHCISFAYRYEINGGQTSGNAPFPGGTQQCYVPEVTPGICDIYAPKLELEHGKITAELVNGHTTQMELTVACTFDYKVQIMSSDRSGSIFFNANKQFRSDLKVNGADLGRGVAVNATPAGTRVTLTSTLNGYDGSIGGFRGSKSIIVSVP